MASAMPADFPRTLGALLDRSAERFGDLQAVSCDGRVLRYADLRDEADGVAAGLLAAGVTKGTRVGLLLPNWPEWLSVALGAAKIGAWIVGLNTLHRRAELEHSLRHADVAFLVAARRFLQSDYEEMLREIAGPVFTGRIASAVPALRRVIWLGADGADSLGALRRTGERITPAGRRAVEDTVTAADTAAVFFTSGSTATPKAAVLTHAALTASAWNVCEHLGLEPEDRTWTALPLFFSGGFCLCALPTLAAGGCVVLNDVFEPGAALRKLEAERCTVMVGYNHAARLVEHPDFAKTRLVLRKGVGGNLELVDRLLVPGHRAVGNYGMTETATICCSAHHEDPPEIRRTFGRPVPGAAIRIVDPATGTDVPSGEEGEILVRSPAQMSHYYGMTPAECFDERGFFRTGDLGWFDAGGCLHFSKRSKDVIKTMGVNVAAPEVERYLEGHPEVRRAVVVGVPDAIRGENVAAFVVPASASLTGEEILRFCREGLAPYKVPRHLWLCDEGEIPVGASGKVEKGKLRDLAARALGKEAP